MINFAKLKSRPNYNYNNHAPDELWIMQQISLRRTIKITLSQFNITQGLDFCCLALLYGTLHMTLLHFTQWSAKRWSALSKFETTQFAASLLSSWYLTDTVDPKLMTSDSMMAPYAAIIPWRRVTSQSPGKSQNSTTFSPFKTHPSSSSDFSLLEGTFPPFLFFFGGTCSTQFDLLPV